MPVLTSLADMYGLAVLFYSSYLHLHLGPFDSLVTVAVSLRGIWL